MKLLFLTIILSATITIVKGQSESFETKTEQTSKETTNSSYKLFPTQNYWTFLKLNTRNGKIWQVHFTVGEDGEKGQVILNALPLIISEKEVNGRFTLYPTENVYNFILLDQINGDVYQAQWSMEDEYRGVVPIY